MGAGSSIRVQLERCTESHATISGTDIINVARVRAGASLSIDEMNNMAIRGRLAPALVTPVATTIGEHAGEVTRTCNARAGKTGTRVRVRPGIAAVRGPEDKIAVGVGEAAASFIHAGDIQVACSEVAGNLHIADERSAGSDLSCIGPCAAVIGRITDEESAPAYIEVVPGNVHPAVKGRSWIVISPARLSVVLRVAMNAVMAPAIRIPWGSRLVATEALSATTAVQPNGKPGCRWLVVQNNRVAQSIIEGALPIIRGETIESESAVGRDRCTGHIDGACEAAARVVIGDDDLVGIIRVGRGVCLGLRDIRRGLGVVDQVNVGGAIRQGSQEFLEKPADGTKSRRRSG